MGSIEQLSLADFRAIMETNCFGVGSLRNESADASA
jgi:hypothetical protein